MRILRGLVLAGVALGIGGSASARTAVLDSQVVLQRYDLALETLVSPPATILSYSISQSAPTIIEEQHMLYREGSEIRDETLSVEGAPLKPRRIFIGVRRNRYALARVAPRSLTNGFLFLHSIADGTHRDYVYEVFPLVRTQSEFSVDGITIDGRTFLPRAIHFTANTAYISAKGDLVYGPHSRYWLPTLASVDATVNGKPARERIDFLSYRFPPSLPSSTFRSPKPLPVESLPSF